MPVLNDHTAYGNLSLPDQINQLLSTMPESVRNACTLVTLRKNSVVVKAKDPSANVYLILSGRMGALAEFPTGINYSFTEFTPFDMIGELEAITGDLQYAVTVKAITNCKALCMPKEVFLDWLRQCSDTSFAICRLVTQKLFKQLKADRSFLFLDSIDRLIVHLITAYEKRSVNSVLHLTSTRQQIADEIGFCTKTVNRCIKRLDQSGYITLAHSKIMVNQNQYDQLVSLMSTKEVDRR
ncbi:Hypothetical protein LUCI_2337 [Lucifera butyrica]|uniref:Cyclic nucleotide-binding domain-containing protein n=1 Tax=Lucifera butyrica TaxID=1351585 RepID=A0A498RAE8_9FIRM|nr:Crp/Fnr family transcriptional regulator [Lucifera butyrica]VBB07093.1 Hypothetical protein LUCI_2337 [Lucifera butyrica]